MDNRKPNLFVLGAARSGTTWLYGQLRAHPSIYMSEPKEPPFFEGERERGFDYYWDRYFGGWRGEPIIGEASHRNLFLPWVASRIAEYAPEAKLIVSVRNPVDRAYSHWWHDFSHGLTALSFEEAVREDIRRIESGLTFEGENGYEQWQGVRYHTFVDTGFYAHQIDRYLKLFPPQQMKIVFLEDIGLTPGPTVEDLFVFLGVEPYSSTVDRELWQRSASRPQLWFLKVIRSVPGAKLAPRWVRNWGLRALDPLNRVGKRPMIGEAVRQQLIALYREHNRELERLTGRDLSHWDR